VCASKQVVVQWCGLTSDASPVPSPKNQQRCIWMSDVLLFRTHHHSRNWRTQQDVWAQHLSSRFMSAPATAGHQIHAKVRDPAGIQRERRLVLLRDTNTCDEHDTNFGPGHREEFEPPSSIFGAVYRGGCPQIRIFGPATHKRLDSPRFLIPPRELAMWRDNVLVSMATKTSDGLDPAPQTLPYVRALLSPILVVLRGILARDFGEGFWNTLTAIDPEDHGAGVCGRL
jgi:hypothetical protein